MEQATSRCVIVKHIVTQYVQTNAGDFKSVVQSLTAKEDSSAAASGGREWRREQMPRPAGTVKNEGSEAMMQSMEELLDFLMRDD